MSIAPIRAWFVLVCLVCGGSTAAMAKQPVRILVAVGVSEGLPSEVDLAYAERDAAKVVDVLKSLGGVSPQRTIRVLGGTASEVVQALEKAKRMARAAGTDDVVFLFYYSGHADSHDLHVSGRRLSRKTVQDLVASIPARLRVSVFDACRTTSELADKGMRRGKGFAIDVSQAKAMQGTVAIQSSSDSEASQESEALKGAVFTHYFLTGLRGAADRDRDGQVTLDEVYIYAFRQTVRRSAAGPGNVMHPSVDLDLEGAGALVLTETRGKRSTISLPPARDEQYLVYQKPSGRLVAEVWADPRRELSIAVSSGRYLVQRRTGTTGGAQTLDVARGDTVVAAREKFVDFPMTVLQQKGGLLELFHHQLRVGYAAGLTYDVSYAHHVSLRYGYGARDWTVSLGAEYGRSNWQTTSFDRGDQWIQLDLRGDWPRLLGPLDLGAGVAWRYSFQERTERRPTDGTAYQPETQRQEGSSLGPLLMLGYRLNLDARWYVYFDVTGYGMVRRESGDIVFRPEGRLGVRLGVEW